MDELSRNWVVALLVWLAFAAGVLYEPLADWVRRRRDD